MPALLLLVIVVLLSIPQPASAETSGKWIKGAAFPEPSEELVGAAVGGNFWYSLAWVQDGFPRVSSMNMIPRGIPGRVLADMMTN